MASQVTGLKPMGLFSMGLFKGNTVLLLAIEEEAAEVESSRSKISLLCREILNWNETTYDRISDWINIKFSFYFCFYTTLKRNYSFASNYEKIIINYEKKTKLIYWKKGQTKGSLSLFFWDLYPVSCFNTSNLETVSLRLIYRFDLMDDYSYCYFSYSVYMHVLFFFYILFLVFSY